jgi:hypothetical protein
MDFNDFLFPHIHFRYRHPNVVAQSLATIKKIIDNIIQNPEDQKYRKVKVRGNTFQRDVVKVDGAMDFLVEAGFVKRVIDHEEMVHLMSLDAPVTNNM